MPSSKHILTQNDHSRSLKVNCFGVSEKPLRGFIVQYNNCGIACEGSEDTASERSENRHFRRPNTYLMPPTQRTPRNIHINLTLLETKKLHFCRYSIWVALQIFEQFCAKARNAKSLVFEPETDFYAKRPFKVIQGHLFRCQ